MIELIACIVACALLVIAFKIFEKLKISSLQAIVVNYLVAASINFIYEPSSSTLPQQIHEPWFINACVLGAVFIVNLFIMGLSSQKIGASVTSVASKMSLVITVVFTLFYFNEDAGGLKLIGILLALSSVFFIVQINTKSLNRKFIFLPIILFIGGGFIDSFLKYNQHHYLKSEEVEVLFAGVTFGAAFIGGLIMLITQMIKGKEKLNMRSIAGGLVLGGINWLSIFSLVLTLKNPAWDSSTVYTIINIGILLVVVTTGVLVFREKLSKMQWIGVLLAIISIGLIYLNQLYPVNVF